jgi:hypothetical protein
VKLNLPEIDILQGQIEGFVVGLEQGPTPDVEIFINGKTIGKTDSTGKYIFQFEKP